MEASFIIHHLQLLTISLCTVLIWQSHNPNTLASVNTHAWKEACHLSTTVACFFSAQKERHNIQRYLAVGKVQQTSSEHIVAGSEVRTGKEQEAAGLGKKEDTTTTGTPEDIYPCPQRKACRGKLWRSLRQVCGSNLCHHCIVHKKDFCTA